MTKAEIAELVSTKGGYSKKDANEMVEVLLEQIKKTLERGDKIKIAGFGNFEVKKKSDRRGRNPQTGEELTIQSRRVLAFKPSAVLKNAINENS
ncbi:integration host factor subunit alpha [Geobacter hydrogenophilus]|uniref:Integration host factor subunit alpha n=1 Tax=Geobacter hydrogenophilus TaxID=40983 RepID=A0A9W6LCL2_9BACT|nr:integration host factor subunit alpha [Geobacter hydrogenophilus]MBT0893744.1 integration host factor subunit alpha [Geobacter hydrogenophilus]GLI37561.1 integration host factor subunit alpha [Geobacter hydrogenophilus]